MYTYMSGIIRCNTRNPNGPHMYLNLVHIFNAHYFSKHFSVHSLKISQPHTLLPPTLIVRLINVSLCLSSNTLVTNLAAR